MILWMDQVTDRSQSDVDRAILLVSKAWTSYSEDEKVEYLNGLKGCLNTSDLIRIKNNISLLNEVLELNLTISEVPRIPTKEYFDEILTNVSEIRKAYMVHITTPVTPAQPLNDFEKWNNIEQILYDVYEILMNNFNYYCGEEIFAGDETGLLL